MVQGNRWITMDDESTCNEWWVFFFVHGDSIGLLCYGGAMVKKKILTILLKFMGKGRNEKGKIELPHEWEGRITITFGFKMILIEQSQKKKWAFLPFCIQLTANWWKYGSSLRWINLKLRDN